VEDFDKLQDFMKMLKKEGLSLDEAIDKLTKGGRTSSNPGIKNRPKRAANNVLERKSRVCEKIKQAQNQKYIEVGRSVHIADSKVRDEARTYLRAEYETEGEMCCQLCQKPVPFKARDGQGYFKATQIFIRMHKDVAEQFVSLCPVCSAKYDEWVRRSPSHAKTFADAIISHHPVQGEESVEILLPDAAVDGVKSPLKEKKMYFTGTHFIDLREAVIENSKAKGASLGIDDPLSLEIEDEKENVTFVDWLLNHKDRLEYQNFLEKIEEALKNINDSLLRNENQRNIWKMSADRYIEEIMKCWSEYHAEYPQGESEDEARLNIRRMG
jgi:hypothetical protein